MLPRVAGVIKAFATFAIVNSRIADFRLPIRIKEARVPKFSVKFLTHY
jgi:hypothetical protein